MFIDLIMEFYLVLRREITWKQTLPSTKSMPTNGHKFMQVLLSHSLKSIHARDHLPSGQLAYKLTPLWVVGEEIHIMIGRTYTFHRDTPEGRMERRSLPLWGSRSTSCATVLPWVMRNSNLPSELLNCFYHIVFYLTVLTWSTEPSSYPWKCNWNPKLMASKRWGC